MNDQNLKQRVFQPGETVLLSGEYIKATDDGKAIVSPSSSTVNLKSGDVFPEGAEHWIRFGRL